MNGYVADIEEKTSDNNYFRQVLYTTKKTQLVVMALIPNEEIGMETHTDRDQFIRIESGSGIVVLNGEKSAIKDGSAIVIPAGTEHNVINTSSDLMRLYTIYCPPEHKDGIIHKTKVEALADKTDHYEIQ